MTLTEVRALKVGTKVKCKLDNASEFHEWFYAIVESLAIRTLGNGYALNVKKIISKEVSYGWSIRVTDENKHLIKLVNTEWNEENNV